MQPTGALPNVRRRRTQEPGQLPICSAALTHRYHSGEIDLGQDYSSMSSCAVCTSQSLETSCWFPTLQAHAFSGTQISEPHAETRMNPIIRHILKAVV